MYRGTSTLHAGFHWVFAFPKTVFRASAWKISANREILRDDLLSDSEPIREKHYVSNDLSCEFAGTAIAL